MKIIRTVTAGSLIRLANEGPNWQEVGIFENVSDGKRVVAGMAYILEQDRKQEIIQKYEVEPPLICCFYWNVTLTDGQEVIVKFCTNEEKISVMTKRGFTNTVYVEQLKGKIAVISNSCDKCEIY